MFIPLESSFLLTRVRSIQKNWPSTENPAKKQTLPSDIVLIKGSFHFKTSLSEASQLPEGLHRILEGGEGVVDLVAGCEFAEAESQGALDLRGLQAHGVEDVGAFFRTVVRGAGGTRGNVDSLLLQSMEDDLSPCPQETHVKH